RASARRRRPPPGREQRARTPGLVAVGQIRSGRGGTYLTASLKDLPTLTLGTREAAIWIVSPVAGLRPVRAARSPRSKVRNPGRDTLPPEATSLVMTSSRAPSTSLTADWDWPVFSATALTSSALFMVPPEGRWAARTTLTTGRAGAADAGRRRTGRAGYRAGMRCPACPDVTLAASARDGVTIHHCPRCRGVWLDRPDLDSVIARVVGSARPHASQQERF